MMKQIKYKKEIVRTDSGNKAIYTIDSLDDLNINGMYKLIKKSVKSISKDIKKMDKQWKKDKNISKAYANKHGIENIEVMYAGKEQDVFNETLEKVEKDILDRKGFRTDVIWGYGGAMIAAIPIIGDFQAYDKRVENIEKGKEQLANDKTSAALLTLCGALKKVAAGVGLATGNASIDEICTLYSLGYAINLMPNIDAAIDFRDPYNETKSHKISQFTKQGKRKAVGA